VAELTSPSLLLRIRNSEDAGAWEEFVDLYSPIVRSYCFKRRLQASDVDDLVQEVMATISTAIRQFDYDPTKGKFRSWLGTIAANRISNYLEKQSNRRSQSIDTMAGYEGDSGQIPQPQLCADPDSAWVELFSERVYAAACQRIRPEISDIHWSCFEATWVRNESAADVAHALQLPVHQVYVNKSRVLKRLEAEVRILAEEVPFPSKAGSTGDPDHDGASPS
jgi:RNA polymerase sigma factor (sigma-70 family)